MIPTVPPKPIPWNPHGYQMSAMKFLVSTCSAGLFLDPGLGKTSISIGAFKVLKREGLVDKMLVVAPLRVCYSVWPAEVEKWADFKGLKVVVLHGKDKEKALKSDADIFVINPEGLPWLFTDGRFKRISPDILCIDESSKFKHTNTARFKMLKPYLNKFKRRWILTGTPAPNGLMDLFGQIYILDLGNALGQYVSHYRNEFFAPSGFGGYDWKLQEDGEARIHAAIKPLTMRLAAEDYLTLPKLVENIIRVELPPKARRVYDEMEAALLTELESGEVVVAMSAAAASNKCRQVANGAIYKTLDPTEPLGPGEKKWEALHTAKIDALLDLIEECSGQPVLIAYEYQHDLERLLAALGPDTPYIGGGVSGKRSQEIERDWNAGKLPYLLGHPLSMGHGLNLQGSGNHVAWFSQTWDLELLEQLIKRVLRQGSKHTHVFVHKIVAVGTVDEVILKAQGAKHKTQKALLDALKSELTIKHSHRKKL